MNYVFYCPTCVAYSQVAYIVSKQIGEISKSAEGDWEVSYEAHKPLTTDMVIEKACCRKGHPVLLVNVEETR